MDHFNCNALGENWIFSQRIGSDTLSSWLSPNENIFAVHRELAEPLLGVYDVDYGWYMDGTLKAVSHNQNYLVFWIYGRKYEH